MKPILALLLAAALLLSGCGTAANATTASSESPAPADSAPIEPAAEAESEPSAAESLYIQVGGRVLTATLANNSSAQALAELLAEGPLTIEMNDYGSFEKVGELGRALPTNDESITTEAGDLILYRGSRFVIYYDTNTWDFTRLGRLNDISAQELRVVLGDGDVTAVLSLSPPAENLWQFDAPENHNMDPAVIAALHEALASSAVRAMVTARDGVIVDEYYGEGYDETSILPYHSCTKSFTSAVFGVALAEGYIGSLDDPLSDYLPAVLSLANTDKQQITLRHLLTQTSGLEWYEWGGSGQSNWTEFQNAGNWVDYILNRRLVAAPGAVFNYSTGNTHLLSAALEAATGRSEFDYAVEKLFAPLGMDSVQWRTDPQGITDGGNGISMTARDAARFGQLYLQGGEWQGRQLIPADWVSASTSVQSSGAGDGTGQYGYQWWIRSFTDSGYQTFYALGAWGQFIFVVPELQLVTVIESHYPQNTYAPRTYFVDYVLTACQR